MVRSGREMKQLETVGNPNVPLTQQLAVVSGYSWIDVFTRALSGMLCTDNVVDGHG